MTRKLPRTGKPLAYARRRPVRDRRHLEARANGGSRQDADRGQGLSGLLRVARAPALRIDGFADEQLARSVSGRAAGVEVAVRAVLAGLVRRGGLACVFGV